MNPSRFHLQSHVDHLYSDQPRRLAFTATSTDAFNQWRALARHELATLLGIAGRTLPKTAQADHLKSIDRGDYTEEKFALDVGDGVAAPMYLLIPKREPPYQAILAFHGHDPSVQYILGNYPDEATAHEQISLQNNYAQALARAGYLVCAVEQRGFGERVSDQVMTDWGPRSCRHLSFEYLMQGRTMIGERCWDGMAALSYLQKRNDIVQGGFGCTGNSGGGTTTLWLAALDDRISVSVVSCYFCSFKASILGMRHCECNYVPGALAAFEMGDLAAMLAPRPFCAINGQHDPIYPVEATKEQFETVQHAYELSSAADRCSLTIHPDAHRYDHGLAREWFARWL
jgi:dienelactone hydrolase